MSMLICEYRKIKKIGQAKFAKIIGVTPSHINQIEKGSRRPSPELALKIQKATDGDVSIMELLYPEKSTAESTEQPVD